MKATMLFITILGLAWPFATTAEPTPSGYSTLVVQFVGEMDRPVFTTVISTSREEGAWYRETLYKRGRRDFVDVFVIPKSVLARIIEVPQLTRELKRATPNEESPIRSTRIRFVVGTGHDHKEVMLDEPTSATILRDIAERVSKYPGIESHIQEVLNAITA